MKDRVLYIIIGVLIGVVIMQWQQGPAPAQAQAPEPITGYRVVLKGPSQDDYVHFVMLSNGDVYGRFSSALTPFNHDLVFLGNYWGGPPVQTNQSTWGAIKGQYDKNN